MTKMRLTLLVYTCPECGYDTTFIPERLYDIRRSIDIECHWVSCPSNQKEDEEQ